MAKIRVCISNHILNSARQLLTCMGSTEVCTVTQALHREEIGDCNLQKSRHQVMRSKHDICHINNEVISRYTSLFKASKYCSSNMVSIGSSYLY